MEANQRYGASQLDWLLDDLVTRVPHITRSVFLSQDGLALGASRGMDQADVEHLAALAGGTAVGPCEPAVPDEARSCGARLACRTRRGSPFESSGPLSAGAPCW